MRRVWCVIVAVALCAVSGFSAAAEQTNAQGAGNGGGMPTVSALSAVLYEPSTRTVVFAKGAHDKRPMASTTKLMTALVAEERLRWDEVVRVPAAASGIEGTTLGLAPNEAVTVGDLITGMLLESGNDAATALALLCDGSLEAFAKRMNDKAAALGMHDSHFVTPSGLDADGHETSAYDMALLGAAVLCRPALARVCAQKSATVTLGGRAVTVCNHNRLLSMVDGCVGLKTGYTDRARRCLVSAVKRDGVTLIAVTLNGHDYWNDHKALYEAGFSAVKAVPLAVPDVPPLSVAGGEVPTADVTVTPQTAVLLSAAKASDVTATVTCEPLLFAPIAAGQRVGTVTYVYRGQTVATAAIVTKNDVCSAPPRSFFRRTADVFCALCCALFTF